MVVMQKANFSYTPNNLTSLKRLLTKAEDSQRTTDSRTIYESKKNIAMFFHDLGNDEMAIKYFREALESSRLMHSTKDTEVEAAHNLGSVLDYDGKSEEALENFELSRKLAKDSGNVKAETRAANSIVTVRIKIAEQLEAVDNHAAAITHYQSCLSISQDQDLMDNLRFRLGKSHRQIGEIDVAIKKHI
ncbi:hypothetical protein HK101_004003 [Irineochytrium annulatum]|nr:hypothetical protein HK101_004003 [Irineochytrium annulatum]